MDGILKFMEVIYGDTKTLSIAYIIGGILLFVFILLLIASIRKPSDKKERIIEDPKIDDDNDKVNNLNEDNSNKIQENNNEVDKEIDDNEITEQNVFEKTTIIPLNDLDKEQTIDKALDNVSEHVDSSEESTSEEEIEEKVEKISSEIPDVDQYVNDIAKKVYEKNEQFSSVYVDNKEEVKDDNDNNDTELHATVELDPNDLKVVEEEKEEQVIVPDNSVDLIAPEEVPTEEQPDLSLEETKSIEKNDNVLKQEDLKNKLDSLKSNKLNKNDLLSKLQNK